MPACPWCREALPAAVPFRVRVETCPSCEKGVVDRGGAPLRPLDLDYEAIRDAADASSLRWTKRGVWFALVAALPAAALFWMGGGAVSFLVLAIAQLVWVRFVVMRPYARHFAPVRKFVARWIVRLSILLFVLPLYGSVLVPWLGLVTAPAVFGGTCWAARAYARRHLEREHRREGVHLLEKLFLVFVACALAAALVLFGLVTWGVLSLWR